MRASADLREIVSDYLPLKKSSGSKYRALCPFHTEKTPSFYVDADKQLFYCFGCGAGGDVFKFLMLYEKMEFPEALRTLAGRYNIALPAPGGAGARQSSERQKVLAANQSALGYFREQYGKPGGDRARKYLAGRGITRETADPEPGRRDHRVRRPGDRGGRAEIPELAGDGGVQQGREPLRDPVRP